MPWPTKAWPEREPEPPVGRAALAALLDAWFEEPAPEATGETRAIVVIHRGALVAERYGAEYGPDQSLVSWSMAKSITHALVGLRLGAGALDLHARAPVPEWRASDDPRGDITLEHLLRMVRTNDRATLTLVDLDGIPVETLYDPEAARR